MKELKKWITTALLSLLLLPAMAQETADSTYTFRFVTDEDMFYVPWSGNGEELNRLLSCIKQHKVAILDGEIPVEVNGYCTSQSSAAENLAMAKTRSNRVKSEMILRGGLTEACFTTKNHAAKGNYVTVRIIIPTGPSEAELESRRRATEQAEAERLAAEKRAEEERLAAERDAEQNSGPKRNRPKRSALPLNRPPPSSTRPKRHAVPPRRLPPTPLQPKRPKPATWASPCAPTCCAGRR